jgi:hypothetical protein
VKRHKPLSPGSPLRRSSPLRSSGNGREGKAKTVRRKQVDGPSASQLERQARAGVRHRSGGDCEIRTPWHLGRATNFSHRQHEGRGGKWAAYNGLDACGSGTTGCHGYLHAHPEESRENGWLVSGWGDPASTPALIWHGGVRAMFLLDDEGGAALAPFPQGDPHHPDDIPWSPPAAPLDGVA